MLSVIFYICCIGLALSISLAGPIVIALLEGDAAGAARLGLYLLLGTFIFAAPVLAIVGRRERVPQIAGLLLVFIAWTVIPLLAAVPILDLSDLGWVDALFESVSGLTTAGSTTWATKDDVPQSILFWRVQLQWAGGFLALMTLFSVLAPMGIGGLTLSAMSSPRAVGSMAGEARIASVVRTFGTAYIFMTVIAFVVLLFTGIRPFFAATLAMTAISTSGFVPFDATLDTVLGPVGMIVIIVVLGFGATNVFWHRQLVSLQWQRACAHRESWFVLAVGLILGLVLALIILRVSGGGAPYLTLIEGLFNGMSIVSTSGMETRPGVMALLPLPVVLFLALLGGSAYSTAGGLKHYRFGGMVVQSWSELEKLIYPSTVRPKRFGTQVYDFWLVKAIWAFLIVSIVPIGVGTILVTTSGIAFEPALTATIAAFSTAGPIYNSGWQPPGAEPWPSYAQFGMQAKFALMAVMLLGRLEVLAILALFTPHYWRNR